jgi:ankyrin repeat protein
MAFFQNPSLLLTAAENGDAAAVAGYLQQKKDWIRHKEKHTGDTALHKAARKGHVAVMKLLLAAGAGTGEWNEKYETSLHSAAASGNAEAVELILGADPNIVQRINHKAGAYTPLQHAIKSGSAEALNVLLKTGKADLNADNPPALFFAVQQRKEECVRALLDAGAGTGVIHTPEARRNSWNYSYENQPPQSPLNEAVKLNETKIALMLLEKGAKELSHERLLHMAALNGNLELAAELVALGRDINARDDEQMTALHYAAQKNNPDMVHFLLANGANKDIQDKHRRTAIALAQQFALKENIELLQGVVTTAEPVKRKPVALSPAEKPKPLPAPEPVKPGSDPLFDEETWKLAGKSKLVHINFYPELGRRMTEIFNFESRERTVISENLNLRTEAINGQSFDKIGEEALTKAVSEYRKLGGQVDEDRVFKDRMLKGRRP